MKETARKNNKTKFLEMDQIALPENPVNLPNTLINLLAT